MPTSLQCATESRLCLVYIWNIGGKRGDKSWAEFGFIQDLKYSDSRWKPDKYDKKLYEKCDKVFSLSRCQI